MRGPSEPEVTVFAGPTMATSSRARSLVRAHRLRRPVKRGDVTALVRAHKRPGVLAIVDGLFHESLAVGHAELREALHRGWRVWGLSSMGAIRAREMASLGMRGFGRVFRRFVEEDDFQDDEVALLHESTPPYRPLTEPLVHVRAAAEHLLARGLVDPDLARRALSDLKARWFGERTLRASVAALSRSAVDHGEKRREVLHELHPFDRFRVKTIDLEEFLETRPWLLDDVPQIGPTARRTRRK